MIAVISAVFGGYDNIKEPEGEHPDVDFYLFTDQPITSSSSSKWEVVTYPHFLEDKNVVVGADNNVHSKNVRVSNMMKAKFFKTQACHLEILQKYDIILWVDGSFQILDVDLTMLCQRYLGKTSCFAMFNHSVRNNIVDEVYYCSDNTNNYLRERYCDQNMYHQCLHYIQEGFDIQHSGLQELGCFVYKPADTKVRQVMDLWWYENQTFTYQDQISMPYCIWKYRLPTVIISRNVYVNPFASHCYHAKQEKQRNNAVESRLVRSFDCFDTLVIRMNRDPVAIFRKMERQLHIPGFVKSRQEAERDHADLTQIYANLANVSRTFSSDQLMTYEYFLEMSQLVVNKDMLQYYGGNSIVVSDMYWTTDHIRRLMKLVGLKPHHIFVSPAGKSTGSIWPEVFNVVDRSTIHSHMGDNKVSDVDQSGKFLRTYHYKGADLTPLEKMISDGGLEHVSGLCRMMRLSCPIFSQSKERDMWYLYTEHWLPICILLAIKIQQRYNELGAENVLFLSRDMFITFRIFQILFPDIPSKYMCFSRYAAKISDPIFVEHIRTDCSDKSLIIDLQGTGRTWDTFQQKHNIPFLSFVSCFTYLTKRPPKCEYLHITDDSLSMNIERMNYSFHGSFIGYDEGGGVQCLPLEYDDKLVELYLNIVYLSCSRLRLVATDIIAEDTLTIFAPMMTKLLDFSSTQMLFMESIDHHDSHSPDDQTLVTTSQPVFDQLARQTGGPLNSLVDQYSFHPSMAVSLDADILTWLLPVFFTLMLLLAILIVYSKKFNPYGFGSLGTRHKWGNASFVAIDSIRP